MSEATTTAPSPGGFRLPDLRDRGSHAYRIRRAVEESVFRLDDCRLRAQSAGWEGLAADIEDILTALDRVRARAEELRRQHSPADLIRHDLR